MKRYDAMLKALGDCTNFSDDTCVYLLNQLIDRYDSHDEAMQEVSDENADKLYQALINDGTLNMMIEGCFKPGP